MSKPTALYRWYDEEGLLLYVGITGALLERTTAHTNGDPWWAQVRSCTVEWLPSATEAAEAEQAAIRAERPAYNRLRPRTDPTQLGRKGNRSPMERRFAELLLRQNIKSYVNESRTAGRSYDDISYELTKELHRLCRELGFPEDVKVSGETVRRWYKLPDE